MFELRDKIRELDFATDMKFDLLGLYEMSELTDAEKKLMATIIHTAENEEKAAEEVFEILNAPNAVNMDEDCEPERKLKEVFHPAYEELQNGDEIIVNGQHLYVADAEYADDYVWVTDEKEDRYNKRAPGNTLAKYMIDDVIGQPDDDDDEELDEGVTESEEDGLENATQEYTSANTSINSAKLPAIFSMVNFKPETINLDYGGGKFDNATTALEGKGVTNLVYDPYNRSSGHNKDVIDTVRKNGGADTVTCSNVLNVIKEPEARKAVIKNIYSLLKNSGTAYFTVYEGTGKGNEGPTKSGYQLNKKTGDYVEEISSVFPSVSRRGKLIIASKGASITEEFDDDWSDTLETGGEPTYCPDCGVKFVRDEEGDAICPKCNKTPYQLANEGRKNESLNKNELEELFKLCDQLGIHTLGDLELFMKNEGKGKAILSALKDYLFFEIGDPNFQAKDESLKEDNDAEEWEEVASKAVEDSDGFLTDYVWYTDGNKHVFIFGDSDIYRPEDGYFDWEVDIVEGKEAEAYKEAQDWFDSYNGFAEELDEAQDIYDIQGQAVRDARRKEVLDEFKEIFTDEPGGINLDNEETLAIVRGYLEDMGYVVEVSETQNASHPIHIEWFK